MNGYSRGSYFALWLPTITLENRGMELNGAFSNPFTTTKDLLRRLNEIHDRLLRKAKTGPREPRQAPPKTSPVLETITSVLERAERPMRATEIHAAAEQLAGEPLLRTSVKAALAASASGNSPRFKRERHGVYQSAR